METSDNHRNQRVRLRPRDLGSAVSRVETLCPPDREQKHNEEADFERVEHTEAAENARPAPAWTADSQQMACMLSCNPRTIHRLVARGAIPCYRVGRALRFDPERVFEALAHDSIDSRGLQGTDIM